MRPGPLGNPFSVLRRGRLRAEWREAVCDAYAEAMRAAMAGADASLHDIAYRHGLPATAVQPPYASLRWDEYASAVREAVRDLRLRAAAGEDIVLTCACFPQRCHASSIRQAVCQDCD